MKESKPTRRLSPILGVLLILLGILFLVQETFDFDIFHFAWPFFIIIPGVVAYLGSLALPEDTGKGFSALGSILTMTGLLLFYQVTFDHFESWAYAWALVAPTALGLGWIGYGLVHRNGEITREGTRIAGVGLVMFVLGAIFFEFIIGIGGLRIPWAADLWPVLLIIIGLLLLARTLFSRPKPTI